MFDSFPYESWADALEDLTEFWTFGGEGSTGTWIFTVLGIAAILLAFVGFVLLEKGKLERQAALLRASGALDRPTMTSTTTINPNA